MASFSLSLADLQAASPCDDGPGGTPWFQRETIRLKGDGRVLVYPHGFEVEYTAEHHPVVLVWLVYSRLIHIGLGAAFAAIEKAGKTEEMRAFYRRGKPGAWYRVE